MNDRNETNRRNEMSNYRIATVKSSGHRYLIQRMSFEGSPKVHCWGEIHGYTHSGSKTKHGESKTFLKSAVEISESPKTFDLIHDLFLQGIAARKAEGYGIVERWNRRNHRVWECDYTPGQITSADRALKAAEAAEAFGLNGKAEYWLERAEAFEAAGQLVAQPEPRFYL
jgi:hypothetical protein